MGISDILDTLTRINELIRIQYFFCMIVSQSLIVVPRWHKLISAFYAKSTINIYLGDIEQREQIKVQDKYPRTLYSYIINVIHM